MTTAKAGGPGKGSRRSSEQVRALLIEAASREFSARDYEQVTIREIAESVGVSLSVFYRHFGDKSELYQAAVLTPLLSVLGELTPSWRSHRDQPLDDTAQMRELITNLYDSFSQHRAALRAYAGRSGELDRNLTDRLNLAVGGIFHQVIMMGREESDRRLWQLSPLEVDQTIRLLVSMVLGAVVFEDWILPDDRPHARALLLDRMIDLALHGTTARQPFRPDSHRSPTPGDRTNGQ